MSRKRKNKLTDTPPVVIEGTPYSSKNNDNTVEGHTNSKKEEQAIDHIHNPSTTKTTPCNY